MCNINHPKFPYSICAKNVHETDKAVQCDLCEHRIHLKCNKLNFLDYRYLQNSHESWYCVNCCSTIFPFNTLSSKKKVLGCCANSDSNSTRWKDLEYDHNNILSLKPSFNSLTVLPQRIVSEARITKQVSLSDNLNLNKYSFEFSPTETFLQVVPFFTLQIIYHINVLMT